MYGFILRAFTAACSSLKRGTCSITTAYLSVGAGDTNSQKFAKNTGFFSIQVLTNDGRKYEVMIAYEQKLDHMQAQQHILHLELHMPNQLYILNSAISLGTVVTFTSELHLDRYAGIKHIVKRPLIFLHTEVFPVNVFYPNKRETVALIVACFL